MIFLGVDGGGTKTALCLITGAGDLIAQHETMASYLAGPPGVGPAHVSRVLAEAVPRLCTAAAVTADMIDSAFFGIPAYGELSADQPLLDAAPLEVLGHDRYRVDNDVVCGWAGSLAMADGINVVAGTGSIAYGRNGENGARAVLAGFRARLTAGPEAYELRTPRFPPVIGAALFAAGLVGHALDESALQRLESQLR